MNSSSPVAVGDVVAGKYRVERELGHGGMGVVFVAVHVELEHRVALKFLLPDALKDAAVVARFAREAKAAAKIHSPHVARVLDVGALPTGAPFVIMEFMDGEDLSRVLARQGTLPIPLAIAYVLEACEGIAEAHAIGIVHRDVKPANLFLARKPSGARTIKVLDFGIAKATNFSQSEAQLTKTSAVMGSPLYMSPEQLLDAKTVDVRSDIWALGVVLWELIGGRLPFEGESLPVLIAAVLQRQPESLVKARPDAPPALEAVILRCLAKDPAARYANVVELAAALAPFGPPHGDAIVERISSALGLSASLSLSSPPPSAAAPQPSPTSPQPSAPELPTTAMTSKAVSTDMPPPARRRLPLAGIVAAGVVLVAAALTWMGLSRHETPAGLVVSTPEVPSSASVVAATVIPPTLVPANPVATQAPPSPTSVTARQTFDVKPATVTSASARQTVPPASSSVAEPAAPEPTTPAATTPFDRESAKKALRNAQYGVAACRSPDHPEIVPSVTAQVRVTFAPTGEATSVEVEPPLTNTPIGACIVKALRAVKVAPFEGAPVTVFKQFTFY